MGGHHDEVRRLFASGLHNFERWIAFPQQALHLQPFQFRLQAPLQLSLGLANEFGEQIVPARRHVGSWQIAGGIAERRHRVEQNHFGMKPASERCRLVNHTQTGALEIDWQQNLLDVQHFSLTERLRYTVHSGTRFQRQRQSRKQEVYRLPCRRRKARHETSGSAAERANLPECANYFRGVK